jgi:hypothetical protein
MDGAQCVFLRYVYGFHIVMMIYKSEGGLIWARPKMVFFEPVQHEGRTVPRFAPWVEVFAEGEAEPF